MDIQFCLNPYAVGQYIAKYMCKGNRSMSKVLEDVIKNAQRRDDSLYQVLRSIANGFIGRQEVSAQEAIFHILSLPLRFSSRTCEFINTNAPDKRVVILKLADRLASLPEGSKDVF